MVFTEKHSYTYKLTSYSVVYCMFGIFSIYLLFIMNTLLVKNIIFEGAENDIFICDGKICSIAPDCANSADTVLDGKGMTAIPSFVNMHTHSGMTLFRGICEDMPLSRWLDAVWKAETKLDGEMIYWATRLACIEMIKSGTTAFTDMYWFIDRGADAVAHSGMKAMLCYCFLDGGDPAKKELQKEECREMYRLSRTWPANLSMGIAIHAHYTVCDENMLWATDFARQHSLRLHTHLSETESENREHFGKYGISPARRLGDMGILGPDLIAAHCLWLDDADIELLGDSGVTAVHNINSNLKLASGYRFRYNELRDAGANVALGTDGAGSSNNLDMLETMKTSALLQKAWRKDPSAMPIPEVFAAASANGAKAMGTGSGTLAPGEPADLILVNTCSPCFMPPFDFRANLLYAANSSAIDTVICNGRILMQGRHVEEEEEVMENASAQIQRFLKLINK